MSDTDLTPRLIACFAAVFPDLAEMEIPTASMVSLSAWDSLATLTLIAVIEEEFHVSITSDDVVQFISFDLIVDFLSSKMSS